MRDRDPRPVGVWFYVIAVTLTIVGFVLYLLGAGR